MIWNHKKQPHKVKNYLKVKSTSQLTKKFNSLIPDRTSQVLLTLSKLLTTSLKTNAVHWYVYCHGITNNHLSHLLNPKWYIQTILQNSKSSKHYRRGFRNDTQPWLYIWQPWLASFASLNQLLSLRQTCLPHKIPLMCGAALWTSVVHLAETPSIGITYHWKYYGVCESVNLEFCNLWESSQNQNNCSLLNHSGQCWSLLQTVNWEWKEGWGELASARLFRGHTCNRTRTTGFPLTITSVRTYSKRTIMDIVNMYYENFVLVNTHQSNIVQYRKGRSIFSSRY